ncbi:hypothetical protein KA107_02025 [Candidatus Pacearchaeota archaeon]|nr:hypothetical protein [Candidatus Pacearchaeota archaeon]
MRVKRNENTAELVGLSLGDGGLTKRNGTKRMKFQLRGDGREEKENYDNYIAPLFNKEIMNPIFHRNVGFVFNKRMNFYGISVESVKIEKYLNFLGIPSGVKKELQIPEWIKRNPKYTKRFLRGFFDTDGSVHCQRNYSIKNNWYHTQIRLSLVCTSKNLVEEIYESLKKLGFKCDLSEYKPPQVGKDGFVRQPFYRARICGGIQIKKWFKEIGTMSAKHRTKYELWKKFGFCPPKTNLKERKRMLKNEISPYKYYGEVPERSNGLD